MLKKIYVELVQIRKELQAIRKSLEFINERGYASFCNYLIRKEKVTGKPINL